MPEKPQQRNISETEIAQGL